MCFQKACMTLRLQLGVTAGKRKDTTSLQDLINALFFPPQGRGLNLYIIVHQFDVAVKTALHSETLDSDSIPFFLRH